MQLCDKYSFLTEYFNSGINSTNRKLAHSILFYGSNIQAQYDLALYIARLLNCKEAKSEDCECLNCRWIRERQHPAVLTFSKNDNKPVDDDSKTVISIKQAQLIKNSLMINSDYHRVFIFCDKNENDEPLGLNEFNFQKETANSLLKIIEEPPQNVTFFFLTKDKTDLISTIISRSQCFFVPSFEQKNIEYELIFPIIGNYFNFLRKDAFDVAQKLVDLSKEVPILEILEQIQKYILLVLKSNEKNKKIQNKFMSDIKFVEDAKKQALLGMKAVNVYCG